MASCSSISTPFVKSEAFQVLGIWSVCAGPQIPAVSVLEQKQPHASTEDDKGPTPHLSFSRLILASRWRLGERFRDPRVGSGPGQWPGRKWCWGWLSTEYESVSLWVCESVSEVCESESESASL
jgi:hypothetical protein